MTEHRHPSSPNSGQSTKATDDLSPEELTELREAFRVFDQDGDVWRDERESSSSDLSLGDHYSGRLYLSISSDDDPPSIRELI